MLVARNPAARNRPISSSWRSAESGEAKTPIPDHASMVCGIRLERRLLRNSLSRRSRVAFTSRSIATNRLPAIRSDGRLPGCLPWVGFHRRETDRNLATLGAPTGIGRRDCHRGELRDQRRWPTRLGRPASRQRMAASEKTHRSKWAGLERQALGGRRQPAFRGERLV